MEIKPSLYENPDAYELFLNNTIITLANEVNLVAISSIQDSKKYHKSMHFMLWDWLANNPGSIKTDWPGFIVMHQSGIRIPANDCFVCGHMFHAQKSCYVCHWCELKMPCSGCTIDGYHYLGHFPVWSDLHDVDDRANLYKVDRLNAIKLLSVKIRDMWDYVDSFDYWSKSLPKELSKELAEIIEEK